MNISYSRFSSYLRCPYSHYLGYEIGIKLNSPVRPLRFGTDFHKLLELRDNPKELKKAMREIEDQFYSLSPRFQSELGDNYPQDIKAIFHDYQDIYKDAPHPSITEHEFLIPIGNVRGESIMFKGVIDELYKRKEKSSGQKYLKLGEHKTFNQRPDLNTLVMNSQKILYAQACYFLFGILPRTVIWDYIHSSPATEPIWLEKSQKFSVAKSDKITSYSYLRACKAQGKNMTDPEILSTAEGYRGNIPNYFFRIEQDIIPSMVDTIWDGFVFTARDIARQGHRNKTKNMTRDCKWCSYRDICFTEMTNGNLAELIEKNYIIEPRDDVQTDERKVVDVRFS